MAEIVGAVGVPHNPQAPEEVARDGLASSMGQLYEGVRRHLAAMEADALVVLDSDHLSTFFYNNLPTFCVGVSDATIGPNDTNSGLPRTTVPVHEGLATQVYRSGVEGGFDFSLTQEFEVDHSIMVPLHFMTPDYKTPIVPVFVNGLAPPIPTSKRCYALGEQIGAAIRAWPGKERVAILASGSFSLEIGGPRFGLIDDEWMDTVFGCLADARIGELLEKATTERIMAAGNTAGEIFNWIAMAGALGPQKPVHLERQGAFIYGAWRQE